MPTAQEESAKSEYERQHPGYRVTKAWTTQEGEVMGEVRAPGTMVGQARVVRLYHPVGVGVGEITGGYVSEAEIRSPSPEYRPMLQRYGYAQAKREERLAPTGYAYEPFRGAIPPPVTKVEEVTYRKPKGVPGAEWEPMPVTTRYYQAGQLVGVATTETYPVLWSPKMYAPEEKALSEQRKRDVLYYAATGKPRPIKVEPEKGIFARLRAAPKAWAVTPSGEFVISQAKATWDITKFGITAPFKAADVAITKYKPIQLYEIQFARKALEAMPAPKGIFFPSGAEIAKTIAVEELKIFEKRPISYPVQLYATWGVGKIIGGGVYLIATKYPLAVPAMRKASKAIGIAYAATLAPRIIKAYEEEGRKGVIKTAWGDVKTIGLLYAGMRVGYKQEAIKELRQFGIKGVKLAPPSEKPPTRKEFIETIRLKGKITPKGIIKLKPVKFKPFKKVDISKSLPITKEEPFKWLKREPIPKLDYKYPPPAPYKPPKPPKVTYPRDLKYKAPKITPAELSMQILRKHGKGTIYEMSTTLPRESTIVFFRGRFMPLAEKQALLKPRYKLIEETYWVFPFAFPMGRALQAGFQTQISLQRQLQTQLQLQKQMQLQRPRQLQVQRRIQTQLQMPKQLQVQIPLQEQLQTQLQIQKQFQFQFPLQKQLQVQIPLQEQLQTQITLQKQLQTQAQLQKQRQLQKQLQVQTQVQKRVREKIRFLDLTIRWPSAKPKAFRAVSFVPRKYRYAPSLVAAVFDIRMPALKFKMPKVFTGLELRPILVARRKKKKGRRR